MTATVAPARLGYLELVAFTARVFTAYGVPDARAEAAARALCHGDAAGASSHGLANLTRLYLPLLDSGRADPTAEPVVCNDLGAAVRMDARRSLGLWQAGEAVDLAAERAGRFGVGLVAVRGGTHLGCAGHHVLRAARHGMIGILASNCGRQRIARPPGGAVAMLGTNPLAVAAPAGDRPPYLLDMSTTVVPTGRIRAAAREGRPIPAGWLADDAGAAVRDPAALDDGTGHLLWLGGTAGTGSYKGFGLGLMVETLTALVSGSGRGPDHAALSGDGGPSGCDDDIGYTAIVVAPGMLRDGADAARDAAELFGAILDCPPVGGGDVVAYPGWHEGDRLARSVRDGVVLSPTLLAELRAVAARLNVEMPAVGV